MLFFHSYSCGVQGGDIYLICVSMWKQHVHNQVNSLIVEQLIKVVVFLQMKHVIDLTPVKIHY